MARVQSWGALKQKLKFRKVGAKQVAPVASLLQELHPDSSARGQAKKRKNHHVCEKIRLTQARHTWTSDSVFKSRRVGDKAGGSEEWVVVEGFLKDLHSDLASVAQT